MTLRHLAIVMPAYNEVEGIRGFIDEIRSAVEPLADEVSFHIADDRSTDATATVFDDVADATVVVQATNRGHGPTALAAYRAGLAADPDALVHVDGDGQFHGADFPGCCVRSPTSRPTSCTACETDAPIPGTARRSPARSASSSPSQRVAASRT